MQQAHDQTRYILDFYVSGLLEEKKIDCLKKSGFLNILSSYAADANFDTFLAEIERVAKDQGIQKGSKEYKSVLKLKKNWCDELEAIRKCVDCYEILTTNETNSDYFTLVCSKPHLIVYVKECKEEGPRVWPAKVLSVNDKEKTVTIECFGDYLRADYPFSECILYSDAQENARQKANSKYSKNVKIGKRDEYRRSFVEVKKYIENIKNKYGSFVPAAAKIKLSDVNKHLMDMFPGAFPQNVVPTGVSKPQGTPNEEVNNAVDPFDAGPSTSRRIHKSTRRAMSPVSQGYVSLASNDNLHLDSDSDFDNYDDFVGEQVELPPVDIKIEQVVGNYSQYNAKPNNQPQSEQEAVTVASMTHEQGLIIEATAGNQNRKRTRAQPHRTAKKVCESSEFGHSSNANESVVAISYESDVDISSSSSRYPKASATKSRNFDAILDEFGEVKAKIFKCDEQLSELSEQEKIIRDKLRDQNLRELWDEMLNEFGEVREKLSEYKIQLKNLKEQESLIRAKLHHST